MLIADYIQSKLSKYGAILDSNELTGLLLKNGIAENEVFNTDSALKADKALHSYIPELLGINSIAEGGYRIQLDREGLLHYYSILCDTLGLPNKLAAQQPKIRNKSNMW